MATKITTSQQRNFYEAYGRAVAEWAKFEYCLSQLFAQVTGMHPDLAVRVFFSARGSQARLDMLSAALPAQAANDDTRKAIEALIKKSKQYNETRNRLAHEYAISRINVDSGEIDPVLANTTKLHEIGARADHLSQALTTSNWKEIKTSFSILAKHATNLALGFNNSELHAKCRDTILALPNQPYGRDRPNQVAE